MLTHLSVSIVPIQFIAENIFRAMNRFIPLEGYRGLPDIYRGQHLRLARYPLLRLNLDGCAQWAGAYARQRLHSNRVYRVGVQVRDGGQLIVVDHLILPGGHRLIRIRRVVYLVTLQREKAKRLESIPDGWMEENGRLRKLTVTCPFGVSGSTHCITIVLELNGRA